MKRTVKAGTFLFDRKSGKVALVFRESQNDYSFPKGHLEAGESLEECALRETAEETKREAVIVKTIRPFREIYTTPRGEDCECWMFAAADAGPSDNTSPETHPTIWVDFEDVEEVLTYQSLKEMWRVVKPFIWAEIES